MHFPSNLNYDAKIDRETDPWAPFPLHGLTLIPAWISNQTPSEVCDEITYPSLNFISCSVEV